MQRKYNVVFSVLSLLSLLFLASFIFLSGCGQGGGGGSSQPSWHITSIDPVGYSPCYLVLDGSDKPHIAYIGYTSNNDLTYAGFTGSSWNKQTIASNSFKFDIAVGSDDIPHVVYKDSNDLMHATIEGGTIITDRIKLSGFPDSVCVEVDQNGKIHVVYFNSSSNQLRYAAKEAGGSWVDTLLTAEAINYLSMAVDQNNDPHICYKGNAGLEYAKLSASVWDIKVVTTESGRDTSIAIDSSQKPHISFMNANDFDLKYAKPVGASFEVETLETSGLTGINSSITLGQSDMPHICYIKDNIYVNHKWWTGITWETEVIDDNGAEWLSAASAGSKERPFVIFINSSLEYAEYF